MKRLLMLPTCTHSVRESKIGYDTELIDNGENEAIAIGGYLSGDRFRENSLNISRIDHGSTMGSVSTAIRISELLNIKRIENESLGAKRRYLANERNYTKYWNYVDCKNVFRYIITGIKSNESSLVITEGEIIGEIVCKMFTQKIQIKQNSILEIVYMNRRYELGNTNIELL